MNASGQDQVRATYEAWWTRISEAIEREAAAGERNLSRLLNKVYAATVGERSPAETVSILWGREVPVPYPAANRIIRDWIADSIIERASGFDAIAEMGSGWGYNLFNIWLRGGPNIPYHAFEYTEAGRRSAVAMRDAAESGPQLAVHPFDYRSPDLGAIRRKYRRILLYSSHSIEQVEILPDTFIDAVLATAEEVTCIHFEPIGWQLAEAMQLPIPSYGQKAYSEKHRYNKNLWRLLDARVKAGGIRIEDVQVEPMSVKIYNGTSVIRWCSKVG